MIGGFSPCANVNPWHICFTILTVSSIGIDAGKKLKATNGWTSPGNGIDDYGFTGFAGGRRAGNNGSCYSVGDRGFWWTKTSYNTTSSYYNSFYSTSDKIVYMFDLKKEGYSVRCVKD